MVKAQLEHEVPVAPPSKLLLLLEGRAFGEYAAFIMSSPFLRLLPKGDGHAVMAIPGFGASDFSTRPLRRALERLGYDAHGWGQGRNVGYRPKMKEAMLGRLEELFRSQGRKVSLIGWSLGGVYVRELARWAPQHVRRVITLGSPINGHPRSNNVDALSHWVNRTPPRMDWDAFQKRRVPPEVPCTAIYSRTDGIVAWQCSREEDAPNTENVEVRGSHFGLGVNPLVVRAIAERLSRPEGS